VWRLVSNGNSYEFQDEWDKARHCYSEAIRQDPKDMSAYTYRALLHEEMGNSAAATADWNKAIRLYSDETATVVPYFTWTRPYRLLQQKVEQRGKRWWQLWK
jgi:Tfp pilus assembly protein PilF